MAHKSLGQHIFRYLISGIFLLLASPGILLPQTTKYAPPDTDYLNNHQSVIYLVTTLRPGQSFQNATSDTFRVLLPEDFMGYSMRIRMDYKSDMLGASISEKKKRLQSLNEKIHKIKAKNETE